MNKHIVLNFKEYAFTYNNDGDYIRFELFSVSPIIVDFFDGDTFEDKHLNFACVNKVDASRVEFSGPLAVLSLIAVVTCIKELLTAVMKHDDETIEILSSMLEYLDADVEEISLDVS